MRTRLKDLDQQVIVITGASSGIGSATAKMAAKRGAKVVLAARSEDGLQRVAEEIRQAGGQAAVVAGDVSKEDDVRRIAEKAISEFGRFDTWINDAGVSIYGTFDQITLEDARQLMDVNFFGVVNGSKIAAEHLRDRGGAIINVGSVESDAALPLQSIYASSKHAVKAFTNAMRIEIQKAGWPISVTLIKPAGIDTPLFEHAKNYMDYEPKPADPVYTPEIAAETILYAACNPVRDLFVGGAAKKLSTMATQAPRLADFMAERKLFDDQQSDEPAPKHPAHNLYRGGGRGRARGHHPGKVKSHSIYTTMELRPLMTSLGMLAAGLAVAGLTAVALGGTSLSGLLGGAKQSLPRSPWGVRRGRSTGSGGGEMQSEMSNPGVEGDRSMSQQKKRKPSQTGERPGDPRAESWVGKEDQTKPSDYTATKAKAGNAMANNPAQWESAQGSQMESEQGDLSQTGRTPGPGEAPESGEGSQPPPQRLD